MIIMLKKRFHNLSYLCRKKTQKRKKLLTLRIKVKHNTNENNNVNGNEDVLINDQDNKRNDSI